MEDDIPSHSPVNLLKKALWSRNFTNVQQVFSQVQDQIQDHKDLNILGHAIKLGDLSMIKFFVSKFPDVNFKESSDFHYPIHAAVIRGDITIVDYLLDSGAHVNAKTDDPFHDTPLHVAVKSNAYDIACLLLRRGADAKEKNEMGETPIVHATTVNMAKLFVDNGADINVVDTQGKTILFTAASTGNEELVKYLIDSGVDAKNCDKFGRSAAWDAVNHVSVLDILSQRGVDLGQRDKDGSTIMHYLLSTSMRFVKNKHNVLQYLLNKGLDVNAQDGNSDTPLHKAASIGDIESVKILLSKSADTKLTNNKALTPFQIAQAKMDSNLIQVLAQK